MSPAKYLLLALSLILLPGEGVEGQFYYLSKVYNGAWDILSDYFFGSKTPQLDTEAQPSEVMVKKRIKQNGIDCEFSVPLRYSSDMTMTTWQSGFAYGNPGLHDVALYSPKEGEVILIKNNGVLCKRFGYESNVLVKFDYAENCAAIAKFVIMKIAEINANEKTNNGPQGPLVPTTRNTDRK